MKAERTPNILLIMADQLPASTIGSYGHPVVRTPNLDMLAENGVLFENCYCNSPLCAPSRASLFTGRLISNIGVYDNGCELPASVPTFVHHLRRAGYETTLSGKMHFIGPDQLHGFENRLTTDIYPSSFIWSPDWSRGPQLNQGSNVRQIRDAGICSWSLQLDYDEEVQFRAMECLRQQARSLQDKEASPFFLCVGYTHPHDPFIITPEWWDLYSGKEIDLPVIPKQPTEEMHPYVQWLQIHHGVDVYPLTEREILNARRAFYGMVSYFDDLVGQLLRELCRLGLERDTIVIVTSDHGEMLGEHGMWFKRTFHENSTRVPMLVSWPGTLPKGRRVEEIVSLVDIFPTLCAIGDAEAGLSFQESIDGDSFASLLIQDDPNWKDSAVCEYCGEGTIKPMRMLRQGRYKYVHVASQEALLFDLLTDPDELNNLSGVPEFAKVEQELRAQALTGWDDLRVETEVIRSQQCRVLLSDALSRGCQTSWDWQPVIDASCQYVRVDSQKENELSRYPRV